MVQKSSCYFLINLNILYILYIDIFPLEPLTKDIKATYSKLHRGFILNNAQVNKTKQKKTLSSLFFK